MATESLPEQVSAEVEEDMRGVSHTHLDSVDKSMTAVYEELKRKFILKRWLGTVNVKVIKESKGYNTNSSWMRRITITGLSEGEVKTIRTLIQEESFDVAMNATQLEDSSWGVEII